MSSPEILLPVPAEGPAEIFLQPGEFFIGDANYRIRTLLGSCVSITLWHPFRQVGAMCHYLIPARGNRPTMLDGRYGDEALRLMLDAITRAGIAETQCQAKIFGGGNMFPEQTLPQGSIGEKNGDAARRMLQAHGIEIVSESLYGIGHRQIIFDIRSGAVWMKHAAPPVKSTESRLRT